MRFFCTIILMKIAKASFFILLPLMLLLVMINSLAFDVSWYKQEFAKLKVYQKLPLQRVDNQIKNLFNFFNQGEILDQIYYTPKEYLHLVDVKNILLKLRIFTLAILVGFVLNTKIIINHYGRKKFSLLTLYASLVSLVIYLSLLALLHFKFENLFLMFHQIFFTNDFWLLNPDIEFLIIIFPPELFFDLASRVAVWVIFLNILIISFSFYLYKIDKN